MTDLVLEILKNVQARQETNSRILSDMQQDIRMLRAAINDFAKTNVTSGEVEAIHFDVHRLQDQMSNFDTRLHLLEGG